MLRLRIGKRKRDALDTTVIEQNTRISFQRRQVFEMVFLDLEMPNMDGFGCARALREWDQGLLVSRLHRQPICILSSHTDPEETERCAEIGVDFFEAKPVGVHPFSFINKTIKVLFTAS
jgi:CheY-like chemotaxis protein